MRVRQIAECGPVVRVRRRRHAGRCPAAGRRPVAERLAADRCRSASADPASRRRSKAGTSTRTARQRLLVGYFNRNTETGVRHSRRARTTASSPVRPIRDSRRTSTSAAQWGVFTIKVPKDFGTKKLSWTIVANGFTNTITLHTKADYIVEPLEDAANKNTPPKFKFEPNGPIFTGPPTASPRSSPARSACRCR